MSQNLAESPREVLRKRDCPLPPEDRCCSLNLYRFYQQTPGLEEILYDTAETWVEFSYDSSVLAPGKAQVLFQDMAHRLEERMGTCRSREQGKFRRGCGYCVKQLHDYQKAMKQRPECDPALCPAGELLHDHLLQYHRGVMDFRDHQKDGPQDLNRLQSLHFDLQPLYKGTAVPEPDASHLSASDEKESQIAKLVPGEEIPDSDTKTSPRAFSLPGFLRKLPAEPLAVAINLVFLVAGAVTEGLLEAGTAPWWHRVDSWLYLGAYLFGGWFGLRAGLATLRKGKIDIDLLMILAALGAAFIEAPFEGALLLFLFSLSNVLQDYALDKTRNAIKALAKLRPDTAIRLDSPEAHQGERVRVADIAIGELLLVRPGDRIPLDALVVKGQSSVDQSSITGESLPVAKEAGSSVLAGTINQDGQLVIRSTHTSQDSTIAKVIHLVEQAQEAKARTERFLDTFEQYYAGGVILATVLAATLPIWLFSWEASEALYKAITLMVAASPCALIISTPASILSAIGNGARRGILFKGGVHVEQAGGLKVFAFDKTGTLTAGKLSLTEVLPLPQDSSASESSSPWTEDRILAAAASLESKSEHVIAQAITQAAAARGLEYRTPENFQSRPGVGVRGLVEGQDLLLGGPALLKEYSLWKDQAGSVRDQVEALQQESKTVILLAKELSSPEAPKGLKVLGILALKDSLRPEAPQVIRELRQAGIQRIVMLTGDNRTTAEKIGALAGVDEVLAELLPAQKLEAIEAIEARYGATAMVGDGVNDAPALARARLGIAMGAAGSDVALETADIVLLSDNLHNLPYLVALSRRTRRTLITNLATAMGLIALMVLGIYTIDLPLPLAVLGHEGGTVLVSLNGLRLLFFKLTKS